MNQLVAHFDVNKLGTLTVNQRDGFYWVVDGQHRLGALHELGWDDKQIQCDVYIGLTEKEEADLFLSLNDVLPVSVMDKYKVGIIAGRTDEVAIDKIIRRLGLSVGLDKKEGVIKAPGTLRKVYSRAGGPALERTLRLVIETWGDSGLQAAIIDGVSFVVDRYGDNLDDEWFVKRMSNLRGGISGLLSSAEVLRKQTSASKGHAVAAATVQYYNGGSNREGVKKLTNWWKEEE